MLDGPRPMIGLGIVPLMGSGRVARSERACDLSGRACAPIIRYRHLSAGLHDLTIGWVSPTWADRGPGVRWIANSDSEAGSADLRAGWGKNGRMVRAPRRLFGSYRPGRSHHGGRAWEGAIGASRVVQKVSVLYGLLCGAIPPYADSERLTVWIEYG